jgi:hypothetical protein
MRAASGAVAKGFAVVIGHIIGRFARTRVAIVAVCLFVPSLAFAQADEIQVYDGGLAPVGTFNLTWHNNYTPVGVKTPAFPGGVVPDNSLNGVPEWALGVTRWFEAGLYMPLYSYDDSSGWGLDGFKLRTLFAVPDADTRTFVYGANFEFSINAERWDERRYTSEIRPIIGWHLRPVDVIVNPIVDTSYDGFGNLIFAPSARVAYNFKSGWAMAVEEYADFGPFKGFHPVSEQAHQLYGVIDKSTKYMDFEVGIGFGLTDASDKLTLKLILSRDLNRR